jgi:hypothetical protein
MTEEIGPLPKIRTRPAYSQRKRSREDEEGEGGVTGNVGSMQALLPRSDGRRSRGGGQGARGCRAAYKSLRSCTDEEDGREFKAANAEN